MSRRGVATIAVNCLYGMLGYAPVGIQFLRMLPTLFGQAMLAAMCCESVRQVGSVVLALHLPSAGDSRPHISLGTCGPRSAAAGAPPRVTRRTSEVAASAADEWRRSGAARSGQGVSTLPYGRPLLIPAPRQRARTLGVHPRVTSPAGSTEVGDFRGASPQEHCKRPSLDGRRAAERVGLSMARLWFASGKSSLRSLIRGAIMGNSRADSSTVVSNRSHLGPTRASRLLEATMGVWSAQSQL